MEPEQSKNLQSIFTINTAIYVVYRLVQLTSIIFNQIFLSINQYFIGNKSKAQKFQILCRRKMIDFDFARGCDFLGVHEKFLDPKDLIDPTKLWSLYTVDHDLAYFVLLDKPLVEYNALNCPFVYWQQFLDAKSVAQLPIDDFIALFDQLPDRSGELVYYSNTCRSGTTLLARMLQVPEKSVSFSEPDAFTMLSILKEEGNWTTSKLNRAIDCAFRAYQLTVPKGQLTLIKTQCNCNVLVPNMKQHMPKARHLFTHRRNIPKALISTEKMLVAASAAREILGLRMIVPKCVLDWLIGMSRFELVNCEALPMTNVLENSCIVFAAPYARFRKSKTDYDCVASFESLLKEPEDTLLSLYQEFGLPKEYIGQAVQLINHDSQDSTILSQSSLKGVSTTEINEENVRIMKTVAEFFELPGDFFTISNEED